MGIAVKTPAAARASLAAKPVPVILTGFVGRFTTDGRQVPAKAAMPRRWQIATTPGSVTAALAPYGRPPPFVKMPGAIAINTALRVIAMVRGAAAPKAVRRAPTTSNAVAARV